MTLKSNMSSYYYKCKNKLPVSTSTISPNSSQSLKIKEFPDSPRVSEPTISNPGQEVLDKFIQELRRSDDVAFHWIANRIEPNKLHWGNKTVAAHAKKVLVVLGLLIRSEIGIREGFYDGGPLGEMVQCRVRNHWFALFE